LFSILVNSKINCHFCFTSKRSIYRSRNSRLSILLGSVIKILSWVKSLKCTFSKENVSILLIVRVVSHVVVVVNKSFNKVTSVLKIDKLFLEHNLKTVFAEIWVNSLTTCTSNVLACWSLVFFARSECCFEVHKLITKIVSIQQNFIPI